MPVAGEEPRRGRGIQGRAVFIAAILLFVTTLSTAWVAPLFDPDEGYYPATAAESQDAGAAWDPKFNGEPRWDKPILTYALIGASFTVFGRTVPAARLPSICEGVLLILVVGFVVGRVAGSRTGGCAALVLSTTAGVQIFARVAHPEIGVVLMITAAELAAVLWLTTAGDASRTRLAVWGGVALGLGVLFKGPVAIVLPVIAVGTSVLLASGFRRPSSLAVRHAGLAALLCAGVALPWFIAMASRHGMPFVEEAMWQHNVGRFLGDTYVHRARPGFLILPAAVAMFPWIGFVPAALLRTSRVCREPADTLRLVMTSAFVTALLFYSASGSQLPHYVLVLVPPLAILIALGWRDGSGPRERRMTRWSTTAVVGIAAAALAVAPSLIGRVVDAGAVLAGLEAGPATTLLFERALWPPAVLLAVAAVAAGMRRGAAARLAPLVLGAVLPSAIILCAQPLLVRAYPWERFGPYLRTAHLPVSLIGPRAPSLTFYAGRPVARLSEIDAQREAMPDGEEWLVADTGWLLPRIAGAMATGRCELVTSFGGMTLARWHEGRTADRRLP